MKDPSGPLAQATEVTPMRETTVTHRLSRKGRSGKVKKRERLEPLGKERGMKKRKGER